MLAPVKCVKCCSNLLVVLMYLFIGVYCANVTLISRHPRGKKLNKTLKTWMLASGSTWTWAYSVFILTYGFTWTWAYSVFILTYGFTWTWAVSVFIPTYRFTWTWVYSAFILTYMGSLGLELCLCVCLTDFAHRLPSVEVDLRLPSIPCQPIGYNDAQEILR